MTTHTARAARRRLAVAGWPPGSGLAVTLIVAPAPAADARVTPTDPRLYLVDARRARHGRLRRPALGRGLPRPAGRQDAALAAGGRDRSRLSLDHRAERLRRRPYARPGRRAPPTPRVALGREERGPPARRRTALAPGRPSRPRAAAARGVVIGVVDSGISAREPAVRRPSPASAGPGTRDFSGTLPGPARTGAATPATAKLVRRSLVRRRLRRGPASAAAELALPARRRGHGTPDGVHRGRQRAASRRRVSRAARRPFSGLAPQARLAAYKACWTAPDPATTAARPPTWSPRSTGRPRTASTSSTSPWPAPPASTPWSAPCSAPPRPTSSWSAPPATSADAYAAHVSPWVTTVGGPAPARPAPAQVVLGGRAALSGAMSADRTVRPGSSAAPTSPPRGPPATRPAVCTPGSLDAAARRRPDRRAVPARRDRPGRRSPPPSPAPTGSAWCSSTPARTASPTTSTPCRPSTRARRPGER